MSFLICSASSYVFLFICFFLSFYHIFLYFVVFIIFFFFFFFFFSSRRRHTRYIGDWSSDVCSSDLVNRFDRSRVRPVPFTVNFALKDINAEKAGHDLNWLASRSSPRRYGKIKKRPPSLKFQRDSLRSPRSEERRVGKRGEIGGGR